MRILLVGDTRGNTDWLTGFVTNTAFDVEADLICVLGNFGYWPDRQEFIAAAADSKVPVMFLDGNREHHRFLNERVQAQQVRLGLSNIDVVPLVGNLSFLPRGCRMMWDGVSVAVLGGGRSIDRVLRQPGRDWFHEEGVSDSDLKTVQAGGKAKVFLTHDAPASVPLPVRNKGDMPRVWWNEFDVCAEHRERLNFAFDTVQPELLVHGHYQLRWAGDVQRAWGVCKVVGFDDDEATMSSVGLLVCGSGQHTLFDFPTN